MEGIQRTKKTPRRSQGNFVYGVSLTNHTVYMEFVFFMSWQSDILHISKPFFSWNLLRDTCLQASWGVTFIIVTALFHPERICNTTFLVDMNDKT